MHAITTRESTHISFWGIRLSTTMPKELTTYKFIYTDNLKTNLLQIS